MTFEKFDSWYLPLWSCLEEYLFYHTEDCARIIRHHKTLTASFKPTQVQIKCQISPDFDCAYTACAQVAIRGIYMANTSIKTPPSPSLGLRNPSSPPERQKAGPGPGHETHPEPEQDTRCPPHSWVKPKSDSSTPCRGWEDCCRSPSQSARQIDSRIEVVPWMYP